MADAPMPDFHIPHAEKIEWMIETKGWAIEPVGSRADVDPPRPGYAYTIGLPERFGFPEIVVFGLTPVAASGLVDLVAQQLEGGVEIPCDVPLQGLLDNDLRCVFSTVDVEAWQGYFSTGWAWHRGSFDVVQLLWPDRMGWLPYEDGFDHRLTVAQPMLGVSPPM
ncbi:MAG: DUF4262 domain-containing protein [Actinomycetota bacterium]|nr:DUF4262 domain-containing protein [Actinomycetota bacterium]MDA2971112.1 DUF4262 domain-containing protein [Actinomycetota bacterium]MDA3000863.1 DUF4262 domain-containing protein [Actinomycetota bacterium]